MKGLIYMPLLHSRLSFVRALALPAALCIGTPLLAQSYSPLFAPVSQTNLAWVCYYAGTTTPVPNAAWYTYFGAIPGSNAHFHGTGPSGSTDPVSSAQPSSGTANSSGQFSFYLDTTKVGQEEVVDVSCGSNPVPYFGYYAVGYGDVYYNDHPTIWIKTGATAAHGSVYYNRYMQTAAAYDLYNATNDYF